MGLNDTNGDLFDLANTISLKKVLSKANKVQIIFMINDATIFSHQKRVPFIDLIKQMAGYSNENTNIEEFIETSTILISHPTHSPEDRITKIKAHYKA
jgi:hypothetical protein